MYVKLPKIGYSGDIRKRMQEIEIQIGDRTSVSSMTIIAIAYALAVHFKVPLSSL